MLTIDAEKKSERINTKLKTVGTQQWEGKWGRRDIRDIFYNENVLVHLIV